MDDKLYNIVKEFDEYHESLEGMLDLACRKAKSESNADLMQRLTDLEDTAKFIMADIGDYQNILNDIKDILKPKEN